MGLKQCLLDKLTHSDDGSGVTISGSDYDENLYMSMKHFGTYSVQDSSQLRLHAQHVALFLQHMNHSVN